MKAPEEEQKFFVTRYLEAMQSVKQSWRSRLAVLGLFSIVYFKLK